MWRILLSALMLIAACERQDAASVQGACDFGATQTVVSTPGLSFDGVALAKRERDYLAVWSEPRGLFARQLDRHGKPQAGAHRLGERCRGGIATAQQGAATGVACLRPRGHAELGRVDAAGRWLGAQALGAAGRDSEGIAVVAHAGGFAVAWHDGQPGRYRAQWAVTGGGQTPTDSTLSDPAYAAGAPALVSHQGKLLASWAETRFTPSGDSATRLQVARIGQAGRSLGESSIHEAAPQLLSVQGRLWVGFRDRRRAAQRAQLYALRLDNALAAIGQPIRVGRANSDGPPRMVGCALDRFALTPRVYGGEMYIGVHALDADFKHRGDGHQYYENSREFVRAAGACTETGLLMFAAERSAPGQPGVRGIAAPLSCRAK